MAEKNIQILDQQGMLQNYAKAVLGMLPLPGAKAEGLPDRTLRIADVKIDANNLAEYVKVCSLRLRDTLPITYPFVLSFPAVMNLLVSKDFPLPAMGMVHMSNKIEQIRPISVSETLTIDVHAENMREHRNGLLVDLVTEITIEGELAWRQVSTFLRKQRTSLSDQPRPEKIDEAPGAAGELPTTTIKVTGKQIAKYADVSGDRNPIHVSKIGAKAFGFPTVIAHGMWTCAAALGILEGRVPDATTYTVDFGKPVLLPAKVAVFTRKTDSGWELALRHPKKEHAHLTAKIEAR
ncbi:MaoC/PaaZ C-terminal domain-containing protein [Hoyosella subflava]|uniref:MaoC like domain protein n=1 Tax=Hoyosella subflava (strain DSM 45089 / JCM 17490 / NBRC 109087 / DQS3-9A1) TaxID=443218 RepID=F6EJD1_HOYSD|nr:MaoC/PaaZ C-terminal domain-containing protein [Hoyosella subflava]AEF42547.1 MaoC like domain protein [Hoyosella subflava DQS3-9A1]